MFASLLPGLRDLRTPLATGYVYLVTLLLLVGDRIPKREHAEGPLKLLYDLVGWMGKPTILAGATFAAYLIGSVLEVRATTVSRCVQKLRFWWRLRLGDKVTLKRKRHPPSRTLQPEDSVSLLGVPIKAQEDTALRRMAAYSEVSKSGLDALAIHILEKCEYDASGKERVAENLRGLIPASLVGEGLVPLLRDLPRLRTRLYVASAEMYGDYDRLAAEADFKVNVGFSTITLSVVAAYTFNPLLALLWVPMLFLVHRGLEAGREANDVLVQAIVTGLVESPNFERFVSEVKVRPGGPLAPWVDEE